MPEVPDAPTIHAPGAEPGVDELRLADAERLLRNEVERAADEGMTESIEEAAEEAAAAGVAPPDGESLTNAGFEESR
jgi:hypothetical protein